MLVLTRKPGESICIGNGIEISVVRTHRNRVRLALNAPADVKIRRAAKSLDGEKPPQNSRHSDTGRTEGNRRRSNSRGPCSGRSRSRGSTTQS